MIDDVLSKFINKKYIRVATTQLQHANWISEGMFLLAKQKEVIAKHYDKTTETGSSVCISMHLFVQTDAFEQLKIAFLCTLVWRSSLVLFFDTNKNTITALIYCGRFMMENRLPAIIYRTIFTTWKIFETVQPNQEYW